MMKILVFCTLLVIVFSSPALANVPVTGITLSRETVSTIIGERGQLTVTITPPNATDKRVLWHSSSDDIAMVSDGLLIPLATGYATITAVTVDGGFSAECGVIVFPSSDSIPEDRENIMKTSPQHSSSKAYAAAKMADIGEEALDITDEKVVISNSTVKKLFKEDSIFVTSLPWFEAVVDVGKIAAIKIPVKGTQFEADQFPRHTMIISIMAMTHVEKKHYLTYAVTESEYGDGKWTLLVKGSETPYTGFVNSDSEYDLMIFIKDGGEYDLDKINNGTVVSLPIILRNLIQYADPLPNEENNRGCSTNYSYILLLLAGSMLLAINRAKVKCHKSTE